MDQNKRFHTLAGLCWHEQMDSQTLQCKHCGKSMIFVWEDNPDYKADPREVLKVMIAREDYFVFYSECLHDADIIELILDTTGLLRDAAIKWMEGRKEKHDEI